MPNITITGATQCPGGNHRIIETDNGNFHVTNAEIVDARNESAQELRGAALDIISHQYKSRRAAGRTHAQALSDLIGFVIRL